MPVAVVVLAAGQGKRMHSALPKVLQPLAGRPLLEHVIRAARGLSPAAIHVVYGYGGEQVRAAFAEQTDLRWVLQAEQLGTGHAVTQAMPNIPDGQQVLILCGDVPLIRTSTLRRLAADAVGGNPALLTAIVDDATGYGRVLRNARGDVTRIVEHKDATDDERRGNEINTGLMAFEAGALRRYLAKLTNKNAQGEYYLTDTIEFFVRNGKRVSAVVAPRVDECLGVNTPDDLAAAERAMDRT